MKLARYADRRQGADEQDDRARGRNPVRDRELKGEGLGQGGNPPDSLEVTQPSNGRSKLTESL